MNEENKEVVKETTTEIKQEVNNEVPKVEVKENKKSNKLLLILLPIFLVVIGACVIVVLLLNGNSKYKKYEDLVEKSAKLYVSLNEIEFDYSLLNYGLIKISDMRETMLIADDIKECDGYVKVTDNGDEEVYKTYITCGNKYTTEGYDPALVSAYDFDNTLPSENNAVENNDTTETDKKISTEVKIDETQKSESTISTTLNKSDYELVKLEKKDKIETDYYKVNISIENGNLIAINSNDDKVIFNFKNAEKFILGKDTSMSVDGQKLYVITKDGKFYYTNQSGKGSFTDIIKSVKETYKLDELFTLFDYSEKVVDVYYNFQSNDRAGKYIEPIVETESGKLIAIDTKTGKLTEYVD